MVKGGVGGGLEDYKNRAEAKVLISILSQLGYGPNQVIEKRAQKTLKNASL